MKTLPRVALALMTLVGPLALADTSPASAGSTDTRSTDSRPVDGVASTDMRKGPLEADRSRVGPASSELEQRVQALEAEVARAQAQAADRFQLPEQVWNTSTDGP